MATEKATRLAGEIFDGIHVTEVLKDKQALTTFLSNNVDFSTVKAPVGLNVSELAELILGQFSQPDGNLADLASKLDKILGLEDIGSGAKETDIDILDIGPFHNLGNPMGG